MADETKQGIWAKLFGAKKSSCCDVKIEEVPDERPEDASDVHATDVQQAPRTGSSCCCQPPKK